MKRSAMIALLIALLVGVATPALAEFEGFDVVVIGGGDDGGGTAGAEEGEGLALTLGEAEVLDSWNGERDPHFAYVAVAAKLMNWTTDRVVIADSVAASLVYRETYTYEGAPEFPLESLGMLERLDGRLVFRVPLIVARAGEGDLELVATAQGEEIREALELTGAVKAAGVPEPPFDCDDPQGDRLEAALGEAMIREGWNGSQEEIACWLIQPLKLINWTGAALPLNGDTLSGSLAYMDKYAFQGAVEYGQDQIEPLEIVDATLAIRVPTVVSEAGADDAELWLETEGFEYSQPLDMPAAVKAGAAIDGELRRKYSPGAIVTFGSYEQDNDGGDGAEPIDWIVLARKGNWALLTSRYALDVQMYNDNNSDITWETSLLRAWMNETFIDLAFTDGEQALIPAVTVDNSREQGYYDTPGGRDTRDKVFALSYAEVVEYLPDAVDRQLEPTAYARASGAYINDGHVHWLTRSPGETGGRVMRIVQDGDITEWNNKNEGYNNICARPALWLDLDGYEALAGESDGE